MDPAPCLVLDAATVRVDDVGPALARLTTGWRLRIVGPQREVLLLRAAALAHGALDAEITVEVVDRDARTVFCAHCHHLFPTSGGSVRCPGCGLALRVADHVSRRHGAYLGEPA
ncbi:dimethylamine monooxygenase subunit DmmA family protein [Actinomycetospora sp. NBRC 106378]|uniref:dimethylamine monooxygenase subunit DmmA family protein n=1 Tax=Actinomycetospora sp. NBRC 106378 TaxID=3032208 RepID=UPI0025558271|nr:dimethylamine monooxygenase subunit DmmA family protein [Actinomycetospora sp. NBRC 106378]